MDPVTAIGVASAIVQFVDFGIKVAKKLDEEIHRAAGDVPAALESINTQLPLILNALSRMNDEKTTRRLDADTRGILNGVVLGCFKLASEIDEILQNLATKSGEGLARKLKKVLTSMKKETRVIEINQGLLAYVQVLVLHQVVDKNEVQAGPPPETEFFEVKEKRISGWLDRTTLMNRLDQHLLRVVRGQTKHPEWLILDGPIGVGKTQLALEYCHQVYERAQFRTIFWFDASTPENLMLSIENAASIVKRTRDGTRAQKLSFFSDFLAARYQPWMIVVDGYESLHSTEKSLTSLLPADGHGAILVTTRGRGNLESGIALPICKFRTVAEYDRLRREATGAISKRDIERLVDALAQDLEVDCYTKTAWQNKVMPLVNHAAQQGFEEAVKLLLKLGANHEQDPKIGSVVESAKDASTLNTILDWEEQSGHYATSTQYQNLVKRATREGDTEIIKTMLKRRLKDYNANNECYVDSFSEAAKSGQVDMLRALWPLGHMPSDEVTKACMLSCAIEATQLDTVLFLLQEVKCDVNMLAFGAPILYVLMQQKEKRQEEFRNTVVPLLLAANASPNAFKPSMGKNPFHLAAMYGWLPVVTAFIQYGGDVTLKDGNGDTPITIAATQNHAGLYQTLANADITDPERRTTYLADVLFHAVRTGDRDLALAAMKSDAIINSVDFKSGDTPLLAAIRSGDRGLPVARMLIRKGARQQGVTDREGRTPLLIAAELGLTLVVRDLARAKDSPGVEAADRDENTPLLAAVRAGHESTVEVLLSLGADRDAMNKYGETAEDIAEEKGLKKVMEKLQGFELVN